MIFQEPMTSLNPVSRSGEQIAEAIALHQGLAGSGAATRAVEMLRLGAAFPSPNGASTSIRTSFRAACASA